MLVYLEEWREKVLRGEIMHSRIAEEIGRGVVQRCSNDDQPFLSKFVTTQMFTQYIEANSEIQF